MSAAANVLADVRRDRRRYQREVEGLLEQIGRQVGRLQLLKAGGARGGALAGRKRELQRTRARLAKLVSGPPRPG